MKKITLLNIFYIYSIIAVKKGGFYMASAGNSYTIKLKSPHLKWGVERYTGSRDIIYGEGYIPIPADIAYDFKLLNLNGTNGQDIFGQNLFHCKSVDGHYEGTLRAQGNQSDDRYAKQFSGDNNLKAIGSWYAAIGAAVGDTVKVTWTSPIDIIIEKL